jgi:peptidoglycan/xylan/chitin deacetylase (PgdA/CDA1 family)
MIRNFLFHRVNRQKELLWGPMEIKLFEKHINYISKHYEVALLEDIAFEKQLPVKKKTATVAFDDGYKDNIEYALGILDKYRIKASFYVVTDCIEKNLPIWTHILDYSFQHTRRNEIDMRFDFLPDDCKVTHLPGINERIAYVKKLKLALKKITHLNRDKVIERVLSSFNDVVIPKLMMNWDDLAELKANGHYIGSHTTSHHILDTMDDEADVKKELVESRNRIKEKLGHFPITIAYPNGNYNEKVIALSKEAGYKIGVTAKEGIFDPAKDNIFEVPRIVLYNEPWWKAKLRLSTKLQDIKKIIRYK